MNERAFAARLTLLRLRSGVSARDMSLRLGQSTSYINKIENARALPSMEMFFEICEFLHVTPHEFFDEGNPYPGALREVAANLRALNPQRFEMVAGIVKELI